MFGTDIYLKIIIGQFLGPVFVGSCLADRLEMECWHLCILAGNDMKR